jgi:hypothetical protein
MKTTPILRLALIAVLAVFLTNCGSDDDMPDNGGTAVSLGKVVVTLDGFSGSLSDIDVELRNTQAATTFTKKTNADGKATFNVTSGIYQATASVSRKLQGNSYLVLNGTSGQIVVKSGETTDVTVTMHSAAISQVIIKELYNGGVMKDDGKAYQLDKCFILYNNSSIRASLDNLCVGMASPYNSQATNKWYDDNGHLVYESKGTLPAADGIWYFPNTLEIEPYSQVVVNVHGAIDNTLTYPQSVNYASKDYYCMYDPESGYANASYYPTPADVIPASHYLKAVRVGKSNAWPLSVTSPALFVFQTKGTLPAAFAGDVSNHVYTPGMPQTDVYKNIEVPSEWIVDAVEVFSAAHPDANLKRLTANIDAGYVMLTNQHGHSLYRNVNKEATEALTENAGKLVYDYALGVAPSTDPSGIDAEASIKNGAHIIYMDTNNASTDFHERQTCSLKNR